MRAVSMPLAALVALAALAATPAHAAPGAFADVAVGSGAFAEWDLAPASDGARAGVFVDGFRANGSSGERSDVFVGVYESRCEGGETIVRAFGGSAPGSVSVTPWLGAAATTADVVVEGTEYRHAGCFEDEAIGEPQHGADAGASAFDDGEPVGTPLGSFPVRVEVEWAGEGRREAWAWPYAGRHPGPCAFTLTYADVWRAASARGSVSGALPLTSVDLADVEATDFAALYSGASAVAEGCIG